MTRDEENCINLLPLPMNDAANDVKDQVKRLQLFYVGWKRDAQKRFLFLISRVS